MTRTEYSETRLYREEDGPYILSKATGATLTLAISLTGGYAILLLSFGGTDLGGLLMLTAIVLSSGMGIGYLALTRQRGAIGKSWVQPKSRSIRRALTRQPFVISMDEVVKAEFISIGGLEWANRVYLTLTDGSRINVNTPPFGREGYGHLVQVLRSAGLVQSLPRRVGPPQLDASTLRLARVALPVTSFAILALAVVFSVSSWSQYSVDWTKEVVLIAVLGLMLLLLNIALRAAHRDFEN